LIPLVGLLAYGGGIALYFAEGVHWSLGTDTYNFRNNASALTSVNSPGIGFWLCAAGWLLAALGGMLLWQARRQAESR
jgi:hypothetical protein